MPLADPETARPQPLLETPTAQTATVHGWGGGRLATVLAVRPRSPEQAAAALTGPGRLTDPSVGAIARGMGRAYNDAAQRRGGVVLDTTALKDFELDPGSGTVTAQAGVTLGELMAALVPRGWMVPVVPGTQHVTVGGAIASDIHGKNHGVDGAFGAHVQVLGLLTAAGEILELAPDNDVFAATLGGMGLTGLIVWAQIAMRPVSSPWLSVDTDRVDDLDAALAALQAPGGKHRVAWLDLLGRRAGRGVVTRAEHVGAPADGTRRDPASGATVAARATVPEWFPGGLLTPASIGAFNELRFRAAPRAQRGHLEGIAPHMFPLDGLVAWPRLYGRQGFVQYQLVVPYGAEAALHTVLERLARSRVPCYLAVLKDFGPAGIGPLSFPIPGWTLTLDMPRRAPGLDRLQDDFDVVVTEAGGRVYLSKDARVAPDTLAAMYPRLQEWRAVRDRVDPERVWRSDLALRTGLLG
jgi:decaprenylphospho-beta-D-ribofuranose 2-oxidase